METVFDNNGMTCKIIAAAYPAGNKFGLALVHLCDGQQMSQVVCSHLETAVVNGKSVCTWGHGHYFESLFDARIAFMRRFIEF